MENCKKINSNNIVYFLLIVVGLLILIPNVFFVERSENEDKDITEVNKKNKYSFRLLDANDRELNNEQKVLAKFFDENYFFLNSYEEILRYSDTLKNIRVATYCQVKKFLSTDEENYEVVCNWGNSTDEFMGTEELGLVNSIVIKGKKPESMFLVNDIITIKGKLVGAQTISVDGKTEYLPVIEAFEVGKSASWHSESTIREVAKIVFGNDIKVRRPTQDETNKMVFDYFYSYQDSIWLVEFENQSNLNFKVFDIWQDMPSGIISYNALYNQGIESDYLNKKLYITPDLQKYIVFDMSRGDKYIYISVYNRKLEKLWSREISNVSNVVWDATDDKLIFVSDNDMYNIDIETGKDLMKPIYVGKKISVTIVENGYLLLSESSDDAIMFIDNDGNVKNKFDIDIKISEDTMVSTDVQRLGNNYVILYSYIEVKNTIDVKSKYITINQYGDLISNTK